MWEKRNENSPLVSVVMAAYNAGDYIQSAIASVQSQTMPHWELLVIDDCSSDDTRELVRRMAGEDSRIRLVCNARNCGTADSRNRGFDLSRGEYVALLDSDDCWRPNKLEMQLALAQEEQAELVYSSYALVDEAGRPNCKDYIVPRHTDLKRMLRENVMGCSTVMLSRTVTKRFRFSGEYYHEDYALWLRLLREGIRCAGVEEVLVDYRMRSNSRASNKIACAKRRWHIYRSLMKLSVAESGVYLVGYMVSGLNKYRKK